MPRRYRVLVAHPGETRAFRDRFQQAVAVCLAWRMVATLAAGMAFRERGTRLATYPGWAIGLIVAYLGYTAFLLWLIGSFEWQSLGRSVRLGAGSRAWLDMPSFYWIDLIVACSCALALAQGLRPGTAYAPYADVFSVAIISAIALWTARRGGRQGLKIVALGAAVVVGSGLVNGISISAIPWNVVAARCAWLFAGWIVALGVVRILLDYAERVVVAEMDEQRLELLSRAHDQYKVALKEIALMLTSETDCREEAAQLATKMLVTTDQPIAGPRNLKEIVKLIAAESELSARHVFQFLVVPGVPNAILLNDPLAFEVALRNACMNAVQHSGEARATIHWRFDEGDLLVTIRDNGKGVGGQPAGSGMALIRETMEKLGGSAEMTSDNGTRWGLTLPKSSFTVAEQ